MSAALTPQFAPSIALLQRLWRRLELVGSPQQWMRKLILRVRGAVIGEGTQVPRLLVTWPHQVSLGRDCVLQPDVFFNYSHFWTPGPSMIFGDRVFLGRGCEFNIRERITVGDDCLIASGCTFVDSDHGTDGSMSINTQPIETCAIVLERNVWLGAKCVVLKGVHIGERAIVGAGSVVTKSIPAGEVWAGVPARRLHASGTALYSQHITTPPIHS
jgi:carbonic anhydrase/acetyltransferase-like protein (isoleucine patch superfamily)